MSAELSRPVQVESDLDVVRVQDVELDRAARRIRARGRLMTLPHKEFQLLELLMLNAGRAFDRGTLLTRLWGANFRSDVKTVDTHIVRLRRKIETEPHHPTRIRTVRGYGYVFDVEPVES
jgi:DNA-binding response OmpR family regulator